MVYYLSKHVLLPVQEVYPAVQHEATHQDTPHRADAGPEAGLHRGQEGEAGSHPQPRPRPRPRHGQLSLTGMQKQSKITH